jgi:hypothetical protein
MQEYKVLFLAFRAIRSPGSSLSGIEKVAELEIILSNIRPTLRFLAKF